MEDHKKTTLIRDRWTKKWTVFEDRVHARQVNYVDRDRAQACLIFMQEPRFWCDKRTDEVTPVAFNAVFSAPELLQQSKAKITTMSKKQKVLVQRGLDEIQRREELLEQCIAPDGKPKEAGKIMSIVSPKFADTVASWDKDAIVVQVFDSSESDATATLVTSASI